MAIRVICTVTQWAGQDSNLRPPSLHPALSANRIAPTYVPYGPTELPAQINHVTIYSVVTNFRQPFLDKILSSGKTI